MITGVGNINYEEFFKIFNKAFLSGSVFVLDAEEVHPVPTEDFVWDAGKKIIYPVAEIGSGSSKRAISFGEYVCLIPNTDVAGLTYCRYWSSVIQLEKMASDECRELGLKAQAFTLSTLTVTNCKNDEQYSIDVLKAKNFEALAQEQGCTIIDLKNMLTFGKEINFYNGNVENINNSNWNRGLFQTLINELVIATAYNIPCSFDSRNFYIAHSDDDSRPPAVHLYLYDFTHKMSSSDLPEKFFRQMPVVPKQELILSIFKGMLSDVLYYSSQHEHDALGFAKSSLCSEMAKTISSSIVENAPLMNEMLNEAYAQDKIVSLVQSSLSPDEGAPAVPMEESGIQSDLLFGVNQSGKRAAEDEPDGELRNFKRSKP